MTFCRMTQKGQGLAYEVQWASKMVVWANECAEAVTYVHDLGGPYDESTY